MYNLFKNCITHEHFSTVYVVVVFFVMIGTMALICHKAEQARTSPIGKPHTIPSSITR